MFRRLRPKAIQFTRSFLTQCKEDRVAVTAGHLAYVTLLSLVPFIMMFFAILQAFPAFQSIRVKVEDFIFHNFVPAAGDTIRRYVFEFANNASEMGIIGIGFLVVVALLLISNVDKTLNHIWRTNIERRKIFTFAIYWMVLTLGPLLVGSSLAMTSYLISLTTFAEEYTPGITTFVLRVLPFLISFGVYFILYMVVPNQMVRAKDAAAGAVFAAVLFELGKKVFALYVTSFPSYKVIYGALAAVPILFVWVYLSWVIVLLGAVLTVQVEKWRILNIRPKPEDEQVATSSYTNEPEESA
ncbi:virulence factor BrkB family protein [Planctobacterium marinum]|nr:virulence factor BrkB family protein [Planctobacterium marinum]MCC2606625.1 virulence factor BrkB family protein [Planctobacterium marinum]